jgi:hypothetical protein
MIITPIKINSGKIRPVMSWLVFGGKLNVAVDAETPPVTFWKRVVLVGVLVFVFVGSFVGDGSFVDGVPPVEVDNAVLVFVAETGDLDVFVATACCVLVGTKVLAAVAIGVLLGCAVSVSIGGGVSLGCSGVSVGDGAGAYPWVDRGPATAYTVRISGQRKFQPIARRRATNSSTSANRRITFRSDFQTGCLG